MQRGSSLACYDMINLDIFKLAALYYSITHFNSITPLNSSIKSYYVAPHACVYLVMKSILQDLDDAAGAGGRLTLDGRINSEETRVFGAVVGDTFALDAGQLFTY
jgi:hypothetical protein